MAVVPSNLTTQQRASDKHETPRRRARDTAILAMAIIRGVRGLEVTIKVAGEKAQEYDPTENTTIPADLEFHIPDCIGSETPRSDDNIPYVVKFVEATPGALFHIRVKQLVNFQFSSHHIGYSVAVDSLTTGVSHEECDKNRQLGIPWDAKSSHWISKDETGAWQRNYFRFAQLPVGESFFVQLSRF